jgi:hypothetical protein
MASIAHKPLSMLRLYFRNLRKIMKKQMLPIVLLCISSLALLIGLKSPTSSFKEDATALSKEKRVALLLHASREAEKKMGLYREPGGGYYLNCMGSYENEVDCQRFFEHMLNSIKTSPHFENLTLADLTNPSFFKDIASDYQEAFFNGLEG